MLENRNSEGWDYKSQASQCGKFQKLIKNSNTKKSQFCEIIFFFILLDFTLSIENWNQPQHFFLIYSIE